MSSSDEGEEEVTELFLATLGSLAVTELAGLLGDLVEDGVRVVPVEPCPSRPAEDDCAYARAGMARETPASMERSPSPFFERSSALRRSHWPVTSVEVRAAASSKTCG